MPGGKWLGDLSRLMPCLNIFPITGPSKLCPRGAGAPAGHFQPVGGEWAALQLEGLWDDRGAED